MKGTLRMISPFSFKFWDILNSQIIDHRNAVIIMRVK